MATDVIMPQMGESIAEGTITKWLVREGETVERDQPLFEISTDKVDAEIPSPEAGVLLEIVAKEGDTVEVDEVVARIGEEGEATGKSDGDDGDGGDEKADEKKESEKTEEKPAAASEQDEEDDKEKDEEKAAKSEPSEAAAAADDEADEADGADESAAAGADDDETRERVRKFSSPVVRKMAAEADVDLSEVEGTGIHGRVTKRDLESYLEGADDRADRKAEDKKDQAAARKDPASARKVAREAELVPSRKRDPGEFSVAPYTEGEKVEIEPMSKIRQITAAHMVYSKATSAHVTTVFHMDMTRVHRARTRAKKGFLREHDTKLTYMPFIFKAVAAALKKHPKLNAAVDGSNIVYKKEIHLGMAVALDWGLLVPVIPHADQLNLVGLAKTANDLAERARSKRLSPDEIRRGTFTVTNPGVFGSQFGTPVINQPQVAILGIGAIEKRPVVETSPEGTDALAIRTMAYFSITYDHRLVDGADADHFMNSVKKTLEEDAWTELEAFSS